MCEQTSGPFGSADGDPCILPSPERSPAPPKTVREPPTLDELRQKFGPAAQLAMSLGPQEPELELG